MGSRVHLGVAAAHLFMLPLATAPSAISFAALMAVAAVRLPAMWSALGPVWRAPAMWAMVAWAAWHGASTAWSADPAQGWDELGAMRMVLLVPALWPVLNHAAVLISIMLAGVFVQNGIQAFQDLGWIMTGSPAVEGRSGGWLHPIQTGAWCVAALCWHLSSLLTRGSHRSVVGAISRSAAVTAAARTGFLKGRLPSILGLAAAAGGLLLSGSRGPWLAALVALPAATVWIARRCPATRRAVVVMMLIGLTCAAAAWPLAGSAVRARINEAAREVREATGPDQVIWTSAGLRLAMWSWAWDALRARPLTGIGAGAFKSFTIEQPGYRRAVEMRPRKADYLARDHPHSVYLHVLACTGGLGGLIVAATIAAILLQGWRDRVDHPYACGMLPALLAWLVGAQFECYQLNGHTLGLLMVIVALTLPGRPSAVRTGA